MNLQEFEKFLNEKGADLREAMTRSDFNAFMTKGLKGLILDSYSKAAAQTNFQEIVVVDDSESNLEDYPTMGDPEMPRLVKEGEEFKTLNPGAPDNVKVTNFKYGGIIELTTEAADDDQTPGKRLSRQAQRLGPKHMEFKDKVFFSLVSANGTIYDGGAFFRLNHPGYNGGADRASNDNLYTAVTMSANALAVTMGIISRWEGADADQDLNIKIQSVVCPVQLQQTAYGLTRADLLPLAYAAGALGPAAANGQMPSMWKNKIGVTASQRLDRISTTDWYVKTDFPGLLYQRRQGLQVTQEANDSGEAFSKGVLRWKTSERFGGKVINWRSFMLIS